MSRDALVVGINKCQYFNRFKALADDSEAIAESPETCLNERKEHG